MHFTLSDLVIDITQNAVESGASLVELEIRETDKEFRFILKDNGRGMNQHELERAVDPFISDGKKHPHRKVGLGIPFLIQTSLQSGGGYDLHSEKDSGTMVTAWFDLTLTDTPPVGDISGMLRTVMLFTGPKEINIRRSRLTGAGEKSYKTSKSELQEVLGDLEDAASLILLDRYLKSMEEDEEREE
ncbi:ATP-binding protein [Treponema sp. TIM-1]|uniref:ATP-binding protein n=1 Tax=Treponema sp. TIM-1 TaxID=2898417 RepID=UPI003980ACFC